MEQIRYRPTASPPSLANPLLQAVAHGLAQLMPITDCETWPQPLLELLARMEDPEVAIEDLVEGSEAAAQPLVVVVGRCPSMAEQAATLLRASTLDVVCCDSGEQAVSVLKRRGGEVALVVADQQLAGPMDGFGLARALGLLWPGIPVILATERAASNAASRLTSDPLPAAVTQLDKPWLPLSLLVEAHRALDEAPLEPARRGGAGLS